MYRILIATLVAFMSVMTASAAVASDWADIPTGVAAAVDACYKAGKDSDERARCAMLIEQESVGLETIVLQNYLYMQLHTCGNNPHLASIKDDTKALAGLKACIQQKAKLMQAIMPALVGQGYVPYHSKKGSSMYPEDPDVLQTYFQNILQREGYLE